MTWPSTVTTGRRCTVQAVAVAGAAGTAGAWPGWVTVGPRRRELVAGHIGRGDPCVTCRAGEGSSGRGAGRGERRPERPRVALEDDLQGAPVRRDDDGGEQVDRVRVAVGARADDREQ